MGFLNLDIESLIRFICNGFEFQITRTITAVWNRIVHDLLCQKEGGISNMSREMSKVGDRLVVESVVQASALIEGKYSIKHLLLLFNTKLVLIGFWYRRTRFGVQYSGKNERFASCTNSLRPRRS